MNPRELGRDPMPIVGDLLQYTGYSVGRWVEGQTYVYLGYGPASQGGDVHYVMCFDGASRAAVLKAGQDPRWLQRVACVEAAVG